jgi:hypothetical protein
VEASKGEFNKHDPANTPASISGKQLKSVSSDKLISLAAANASFFTSPDETAWASIEVKGHRETHAISSPRFKTWLTHIYYLANDRAPNADTLSQVLATLDARARFDGDVRDVFLRTGAHEGKIYLDLGDASWRTVEIDGDGWRVRPRTPVPFRRQKGMLALPEPVRGGSIEALRPFLNVARHEDFILIVSWMLAALRPKGPYPLLALAGEPGAAKSTAAKAIRSLVDPNVAALRSAPREERDVWIAAKNASALAYDNLSSIPIWLSDALCRIATGGGYAARQLGTDAEETLFDLSRPIVLTAVGDVIHRSDLADRAIMIELKRIDEQLRRDEETLHRALAEARPAILGALLDALSHGLANADKDLPSQLPRLADFALWASRCEGAFAEGGAVMAALKNNAADAAENVLESDPVCVAVLAFLDGENSGHWRGTAAELLGALRPHAAEGARGRDWPRTPRAMSSSLRMAQHLLAKRGVTVKTGKSAGKRYVELTRFGS